MSIPLSVRTMLEDRSASHDSTASVTATGSRSGTTSPTMDLIAVMCFAPSLNTTEWIPAKSFLRCAWITSGFFACPRISSRSSSPMK